MDKNLDSNSAVRSSGATSAAFSNEEGFHLLMSCVQDYSIFMLDAKGHVVDWNSGAERIYGYSSDEVASRHFSFFYSSDDLAHGIADFELAAAASQGRFAVEGWRVRKDGSRFFAHVVIVASRDGAGKLRGFAQVTRDISTRKQMEERFRLVVESAPNAMVMINGAGVIEMVNAQAERVFGYARTEMLGQAIEMLVPDSFRKHHPGLRDLFFTDPLSRPMGAGRDLYARKKDGSEFPVEIGLNPIETEQGAMVLSAIVDISDRKHKEESIKKALTEKDILLGEIHHRVKNNLQIVHSLLDLQCTRIDDPAVQEMLRDSQNRIRSMAIIHQTLYQSRDFAAIDFGNVLSLIGNSLLASYGVDSGRIRLVIDTIEIPLSIDKAIPCGLIVNELVTNALKHAFPAPHAGSILITLTHAGEGVELNVEDNGVGVEESIDFSLTGTLGLQLVNLLTEQIKGTLDIRRANPTRFSLKFAL